ncbi:MAG TPA: VOC family protein [Longimicrobiales bacterium]
MSQFKNVNVVQYNVVDFERAKQFYQEVLEWPVAFHSDEAGWFELGRPNETHIAINRWDSAWGPLPVNGALAVLSVDDAHATTAALTARGIRCDKVESIPGMVTYGAFFDPEGNKIQFASLPPAA